MRAAPTVSGWHNYATVSKNTRNKQNSLATSDGYRNWAEFACEGIRRRPLASSPGGVYRPGLPLCPGRLRIRPKKFFAVPKQHRSRRQAVTMQGGGRHYSKRPVARLGPPTTGREPLCKEGIVPYAAVTPSSITAIRSPSIKTIRTS